MDELPIAEALRLIRKHLGSTQTVATRGAGAPDFRTLSHWETGRKMPSLRLLYRYLRSLGLNFRDLQDALDLVRGETPKQRTGQSKIIDEQERRLLQLDVDGWAGRH